MAKLAFTLTALFFLFAFSHARTPSDLPANEIKGRRAPVDDKNNNLLEPEPKTTTTTTTTTLLLPSERPETESETVVKWEPETTAIESNEELTESNKHGEHVPLTEVSFRPINGHFPRRPFPLSFRHGHRCRHGGHRWSPRFYGGERGRERQIPFGDDMILSGAGDDLSSDPVFRGGVRQIPARWVNLPHKTMIFSFPNRHDDDVERPYHHHRHHHHHDHDGDHHEEDEVEERREHDHEHHDHHHEHKHHEGGLMRRFRKFLNHF